VLQNKKMILSDSAIFRFWQILKVLNGVVAEIAEIAKKLKRGVTWRGGSNYIQRDNGAGRGG
jgi:hypothetical protein